MGVGPRGYIEWTEEGTIKAEFANFQIIYHPIFTS